MLIEADINEKEDEKIYESAREFCKENLKYFLTKMNVNDSFWKYPVWVNISCKATTKWNDVFYFTETYCAMLNFNYQEFDFVYEQLSEYKAYLFKRFPPKVLEKVAINESIDDAEY